jgi:hypothetical protein
VMWQESGPAVTTLFLKLPCGREDVSRGWTTGPRRPWSILSSWSTRAAGLRLDYWSQPWGLLRLCWVEQLNCRLWSLLLRLPISQSRVRQLLLAGHQVGRMLLLQFACSLFIELYFFIRSCCLAASIPSLTVRGWALTFAPRSPSFGLRQRGLLGMKS